MLVRFDVNIDGYDSAYLAGSKKEPTTYGIRFKDFVKGEGMNILKLAARYEENN